MVMRLRRTRKTLLTALVISIALVGSAFLAYASTTPPNAAYPITAVKIKASGTLSDCVGKKCTKFTVNLQRKTTGKISGSAKVATAAKVTYSFKSTGVTSLTCASNVASFHATNGKGSGKANKGKLFDTDTTIDNSTPATPTYTTTVRDSGTAAVVYSFAGPVTGKHKISISC
jgi:hypothetical protein